MLFLHFVHDLWLKLQNGFCVPWQHVSHCIATVGFSTAQLGCPVCYISKKYKKKQLLGKNASLQGTPVPQKIFFRIE